MVPIRLLVVDDSVFMRQALVKILTCPEIEVIDTARNGKEGVEKVMQLNPDVVTMDIEMPIMTGLEALKEIMNTHPVPVIMVSTLTSEGADATMEALSNGAVDFITKKAAFKEMDSLREELIGKVLTIGRNSPLKNQLLRKRLLRKSPTDKPGVKPAVPAGPVVYPISHRPRPVPRDVDVITIGISTGGPNSLYELIKNIPQHFTTPILIAQHMPPYFTKSLANRLNTVTNLTVKEAEPDEKIMPKTIYIAQGGKQMAVRKNRSISISDDPPNMLYKPSVDVLMESVADVYGSRCVGVIMTGMGHDGAKGIKKIISLGGYAIAQDPDSCVISGMPKTIIDLRLADEIQTIGNMAQAISEITGVAY